MRGNSGRGGANQFARVSIAVMLAALLFTNPSQVWAAESISVQTEPDQKSLEAQLFQAVNSKDQAKALALIEAGANVNAQEKERNRLTLLHSAVQNDLLTVVEGLVNRGANVNAEVEWFRGIPLTMALANGYEDIARFLLEHGANARYVDKGGYTMLYVAAGMVSNGMLQRLIDLGCDVEGNSQRPDKPLYWAIRRQNWENATFLIEKGADIQSPIGEVGAPVATAAKYGGLELVKLLVEKGADVRARDPYSGRTALHEAALYGHKDIAEFLINKGADVDASAVLKKSPYGEILSSPIFGPAYRGHFEVVKLLAAHGADLNFQGGYDGTPLSSAAFGGHRQIVEWLVNHGAKVNPFDRDHELEARLMPLLSAVDRGDIEMVRFLLEKGAKVNVKAKNQNKAWNEGEKTALSVARRIGRSDIADLLIAHGATE